MAEQKQTDLKTFVAGLLSLIVFAALLIFSPEIKLWLSRLSIVPVTEEVEGGEIVTTDIERDGATPQDPLEITITSQNPGIISIDYKLVNQRLETIQLSLGYVGEQVEIIAPNATNLSPLVVNFNIDSTIIWARIYDINIIGVFKEGKNILNCIDSSGRAIPDPCVSQRKMLPDKDVELTVLSSSGGIWNLAMPWTENCSDGIDNDGDETVDCKDWECRENFVCASETHCGNNLDDDADGKIDCDDSDCACQ